MARYNKYTEPNVFFVGGHTDCHWNFQDSLLINTQAILPHISTLIRPDPLICLCICDNSPSHFTKKPE